MSDWFMLSYLGKTVAGRTGEYYPYPARRSTTLAETGPDVPFTVSRSRSLLRSSTWI